MEARASDYEDTLDSVDSYRGQAGFYNITKLKNRGYEIKGLPYSIKVLLENALRFSGKIEGADKAVEHLAQWPKSIGSELPFMPYRVLLQDYTGVPLIVDLTAMRGAIAKHGKNPQIVNSKVPVDLIIDHSVQVDSWSTNMSFALNIEKEYERNGERYALLKWAQESFKGMRIFPPGKGICHQVNLEYLATVASLHDSDGRLVASPDTLVGTDSHTTMVNGLGVLGWGVGGIEAEAVMLGEPYHMQIPRVVGVKITGELQEGVTPTDIVLTVTELLRKRNVVEAFVEYFGDGYSRLTVPDRATLGNMSPEYGATVGFSPVDEATITYLIQTGRGSGHPDFVKRYCKLQGLFVDPRDEPRYSEVLELDLSKIEPSLAGPRNPDERRSLRSVPAFANALFEERRRARGATPLESRAQAGTPVSVSGKQLVAQSASGIIDDGSVVIAAITSCTNTSNPTVMVGAGLLARNAALKGLMPKPHVKCSLAPGSTVVKDYLEGSKLLPYLEKIGFNLVGYGCTTCIGNSGPLAPEIEREIKEKDSYVVAVLSGNRNFDGRIHPLAKGSFLTSPMLVVAYAFAGRMDFDFYSQPLGKSPDGRDVYLKDIWPSLKEIKQTVEKSLSPNLYTKRYADALVGDEKWNSLPAASGETYRWDSSSTYIREPPWFETRGRGILEEIRGARVLAFLEDKVTTDHISPAGTISVDSPAALYLQQRGVEMIHFSTYGARRGNHEVMVRGGFSNIRLKNVLAKGREGGYTTFLPSGEVMPIYDAAMEYNKKKIPLIVIAGKVYGAGSSRDWAAKAPKLLGVRAVIAESFERIHRSNLVAMGILPLEFTDGKGAKSLGLRGDEEYSIEGLNSLKPRANVTVRAKSSAGELTFDAVARIDNNTEMQYYLEGGVLPYVFNKIAA
ncbi:MAG: aconitate hydratase AcnA [Thaumarchaeota archaeon]|nr:aconitate hydratase AcnA [Nitrososphaerota archaeon]